MGAFGDSWLRKSLTGSPPLAPSHQVMILEHWNITSWKVTGKFRYSLVHNVSTSCPTSLKDFNLLFTINWIDWGRCLEWLFPYCITKNHQNYNFLWTQIKSVHHRFWLWMQNRDLHYWAMVNCWPGTGLCACSDSSVDFPPCWHPREQQKWCNPCVLILLKTKDILLVSNYLQITYSFFV